MSEIIDLSLKPRHWRVLDHLERSDPHWVPGNHLPDGNGRLCGAAGVTLREMKLAGLIEYGKDPAHSHYGYRLTDAGRRRQSPGATIAVPVEEPKA